MYECEVEIKKSHSTGWQIAVLILVILLIVSFMAARSSRAEIERLSEEVDALAVELDEVRSEGYNDGYSDGKYEGYQLGYRDGQDYGNDEGYLDGYDAFRRSPQFCFYNNTACIVPVLDNHYHHYGCSALEADMAFFKVYNVAAAETSGFLPCPECWESGLIEEDIKIEVSRMIDNYRLERAWKSVHPEGG